MVKRTCEQTHLFGLSLLKRYGNNEQSYDNKTSEVNDGLNNVSNKYSSVKI